MAIKQVEKPYFQEYKRVLASKLEDVKKLINPDTLQFTALDPEPSFLKSMDEGVTKYPLRYYQQEAIYTLHAIYRQALNICKTPDEIQKNLLNQKEYKHIKPLVNKVDDDTGRKAPFIGFEMATGSGKTMLMGASIYYMYKMHNVRNFLIITP